MCLVNMMGVTSFGYHGNVNKIIDLQETGQYHGEFKEGTPGDLCLENSDVVVNPGDSFNFYVYAIKDGKRVSSSVITRRRKSKFCFEINDLNFMT